MIQARVETITWWQACDAAFPPMLYETLQKHLERDGFSGNIVHELVEGTDLFLTDVTDG